MTRRLDDRLTIIAIIAIAFTAIEFGGEDVRFAVATLFVAFIAFLAGCRWERR